MEEETTVQKVSRRRMLKRIGTGAAVAWLTPIVTSLGSRAEAACTECIEPNCSWTCGGNLVQCGQGGIDGCFCSKDVDGNCWCWPDSFCSEVQVCAVNSDCPPGYACIPTCCATPTCLPACGTGRRPRHRHGKMASGAVR
jgi:hypothetical protein